MKKVWLMISLFKRAPDAFRPPAGDLVSGFINLEVRYCSILRSTTKNLLERSVTPQITHNHMRVFGESCYAHIPKEKRKKLDDTGEKCYFWAPGRITRRIAF